MNVLILTMHNFRSISNTKHWFIEVKQAKH